MRHKPTENNKDVLVTDGRWRNTLAVVRSLGRKGISVTCGDSTRFSCSLFSRYCKKRLLYPSPQIQPRKFVEILNTELERGRYGVLFPTDENTIRLICDKKSLFPKDVSIPLADKDSLFIAMNKKETVKFAVKSGIPCPQTVFVDDLSEIRRLKRRVSFPAVIKPQSSSGAKGIAYVQREKDFEEAYGKIHRIFPYPIIQERIPPGGESVAVSALFDNHSRLVASFTHKKIREYPVDGGASTLSESCFRPAILDLAIELLRKLSWFGLAMVEFRVDPRDNIPKLMEINARPWGSIQLPISAGVDFPYLLYKLALGEKVEKIQTYREGLRFRWLIPGDIMHFVTNPKRLDLIPDFFNFFDNGVTDAVIDKDDPFPVLGKVLTGLTFLYDREMQAFLVRKLGGTMKSKP